MTLEEKIDLKKYLKRGDIEKISELAKVHRNVVSRFINGYLESSGCEHYFTTLALKRKADAEAEILKITENK